jgi:hypothetical protein
MAKDEKKKTEEKKMNAKQYLAEAGYVMELINSDTSLQEFIKRVRRYMDKNDNRVPTAYELDGLKKGIDWFDRYTGVQEEARIQQADPRRKADWKRSIELTKQAINTIAKGVGVDLEEGFLNSLALDARLDDLTTDEINARLRPVLESAIAAGQDVGGKAADIERDLIQWTRRNGLTITGETMARYIANAVDGTQSVDDIKNDLRRTYLAGEFPAWSDRIMQGDDPYDIAAPYRQKMATLLEIEPDDISFDDPLLQRGLQGVGPDGKPSVVPLYDFQRQVREDPRWQYTDNAYATYTDVGTKLLQMFGFR